MRELPEELQSHLESGATTTCHCWKVTRRDGTVLGFTDHDEDLTFDGIVFAAATGFIGTESLKRLGLSVDNTEVHAALKAELITEQDLANGLYDNAAVEVYLVNWAAIEQRLILRKGNIGEVRRGDLAFMAEIRGLAHHLQQPEGRLYQSSCDAVLGDARCGIDLESAAYKATGIVLAVAELHEFTASGLEAFASNWFQHGRLTWLSGANSGAVFELRSQRAEGGGTHRLTLWRQLAEAALPGDSFTITAGCDRKFSTCREKFSNAGNFRGFPHIPSNDYLIAGPKK